MKKSDLNKRLRELKKHFERERGPVLDEITRLKCQIAESYVFLDRAQLQIGRLRARLEDIEALMCDLRSDTGEEYERNKDEYIKELTQLEGKP
jgi:uncharacterized coiled-coil protein SlyX